MKNGPWLTVYIVICLSMGIFVSIPQGVASETGNSWDVYETKWTDIDYFNVSVISFFHPVNGSAVSENQKLNFVIVPFDCDEYFYKIDIYRNEILMYTFNQEKVYDFNIYMSNPIDKTVTVLVFLDGKEVMRLEYRTILIGPSLDADWTQQYLQYLSERDNGTLSGSQAISRRDQAIEKMNIVMTTGVWSLILSGIAIVFVLLFQIIKVTNLFSGIVWFGSGFIWLRNIVDLENWLSGKAIVTPDDLFWYYTTAITMTMIIIFANVFYIMVYKATSTRLHRKNFYAIDKRNRRLKKWIAVIGRHKKTGKDTWVMQDSFSALRRRIWNVDYVIDNKGIGDMSDSYSESIVKEIPENLGTRRLFRHLKKILLEINKRKIIDFNTKVARKPDTMFDGGTPLNLCRCGCGKALPDRRKKYYSPEHRTKYYKEKDAPKPEPKPLPTPIPEPEQEPEPEPEQDPIVKDIEDTKEKLYNYDIWKEVEQGNPLAPEVPIVFLDEYPEQKEMMISEDIKDLMDTLRTELAEATDPKIVKNIRKKIKKTDKLRKKNTMHIIQIKLADQKIYNLLDWITDVAYYDKLTEMMDKLWNENHELKIANKFNAITEADKIIYGMDSKMHKYMNTEISRYGGAKDDTVMDRP